MSNMYTKLKVHIISYYFYIEKSYKKNYKALPIDFRFGLSYTEIKVFQNTWINLWE